MSLRSALHRIADELNRPELHDEIEAPEAEVAPVKEDAEDATES